jgi:hypothetical protein
MVVSTAPPPPDPLDAAPPPPPAPASSAPAMPRLPSFVPVTMAVGSALAGAGELHALSMPPGVTITQEPPPPSLLLQLVASLPDVAAIAGLVLFVLTHRLEPTPGASFIVAVLAARAKPVRLGAQAVSGVATLLLSALGANRSDKPAPPPAPPP